MIPSMPWRWLVPTTMVVGAAAAALAPAGPDALVPFQAASAAAADGIYVALVVDFGNGYGGSHQVVSDCVNVPPGKTGYDALSSLAEQKNWIQPSYNNAGLLCAIDGYPPTGCGQSSGSGYEYWSYWHGDSGTWAYSNAGASRTMQAGDVEGWRFQNPGHGNPSDPPPSVTPNYASICSNQVTSTSSSPSAVSATTMAPASTAPTVGSSSAGPTGTTQPGSESTSHPSGSIQAPTTSARGAPPVRPSSPSIAPAGHARSEALRPTGSQPHGSGGSVPLLLGGGMVVILAAGALYRWRRHPGAL